MKSCDYLAQNLHNLDIPFLILQGTLDFVVHPSGPKELYDQAKSKEKKLIYFPGLYHSLFHEPEWQEVRSLSFFSLNRSLEPFELCRSFNRCSIGVSSI